MRLLRGTIFSVLICLTVLYLYFHPSILFSPSIYSTSQGGLVIICATFYPSIHHERFLAALETLKKAKQLHLSVLLVDTSDKDVQDALRSVGARVIVGKNESPNVPKGKGVALRQAIQEVFNLDFLKNDNDVIIIHEAEKTGIIEHDITIASFIWNGEADIVLPGRNSLESLPKEQRFSEEFANLHLNNVGKEAGLKNKVDWFFGPVAFRKDLAKEWLSYEGSSWDFQIVPVVNSWKKGAHLKTYFIDYTHPLNQKLAEEGNHDWSRKRLIQSCFLVSAIDKAFGLKTSSFETYCYGTTNCQN